MAKSTDLKIIEATIQAFVRYGPKKTGISDIAEEAGVSRKTVYDRFGGKGDLSVAVITHLSKEDVKAVNRRLDKCRNLSEQLDVYLEETAIKSFKLVKKSAEPVELISGFSPAAKEAIAESRTRHSALVAELLQPFEKNIKGNGETVQQLAMFVVKSAMAFKKTCNDEKEIKELLETLKTVVLRMTK